MKLTQLYLEPKFGEYSNDILLPFRFQSRSICNYLERTLKSLKFQTEDFKRIVISVSENAQASPYINTSNVLCVEIFFDPNEFMELADKDKNMYFDKLIRQGIGKANSKVKIPFDYLINALDEFKSSGSKNAWVHKKRRFKEHGLQLTLHCEVTIFSFLLSLNVLKNGENVFSDVVLKTKPDELTYMRHLNDLRIDNDAVEVFDKKGVVFYRKDLTDFLN